ncbi:GGDEF domain-containing protein [Dyella sp.]|uniref:GGDEF domain-containing protein n=1 Tax=Dyella sp. TaxID=1869338 RepID=UPI002ED2D1C7
MVSGAWLLLVAATLVPGSSMNLLRGAAVIDPRGTIARVRRELDGDENLAVQRKRALLWGMGTAAINANDDAALTEALLRLDNLSSGTTGDAVAGATASYLRARHDIANGLGDDGGGGLSEALQAADRMLGQPDPAIRAWSRFQLCDAYALDEKADKALSVCRQAQEDYRALGDRWGEADALNDEGIALMSKDRHAEAAEAFERARKLFGSAGSGGDELAIMVGDNLAQAYLKLGRPADALPLSQLSFKHELSAGRISDSLFSSADIARAEAALGRPQQAYERIHDTVARARQAGIGGQLTDLLKTESQIAEQAGQLKQALADVREVLAFTAATNTPKLRAMEAELEQRYAARERDLQIGELERSNRLKDLQLKAAQIQASAEHQRQKFINLIVLVVAAALMAISLLLLQLWRGQRRHMAELFAQTLRDPLTGIDNRRAFQERALAMLGAGQVPAAHPHALLLIDIDHFKHINDTVGHPQGDCVLLAVSGCLAARISQPCHLARIGGEEFAVLCPAYGEEAALRLAEVLRGAVAALAMDGELAGLRVTISIGVAVFDGKRCHDLSTWMRAADGALYMAKSGGRDRVMAAAA